MKNIRIALATLLFISGLQGYSQLNKANRQFKLYRYATAIPLYQKAVRNSDPEKNREATVKLADCYRFVNNAEEAATWYRKATELSNPDPVHYFYLGQALRTIGDYKQAREAFLKYSNLVPNDPRGGMYAEFSAQHATWEKQPSSAEVRNCESLNSEYSDFGPAFYKDGIVFTSDRNPGLMDSPRYEWTDFGYLDLYFAEPRNYKDFWRGTSIPSSMSKSFNQSFHDGPAFFSGEEIYLTRTVTGKSKKPEDGIKTNVFQIYYSDKSSGNSSYKAFPYNGNAYSAGHPAVSSDRKRMVFASDMPGSLGLSDLFVSEFDNGEWSKPINLGELINTTGNEVFPLLVNDTLLFYASEGLPGYGGLDLYVSGYKDGKWSKPENLLAPVNSSYDDFSMAVSNDLTYGFFSSNRPGGKGNDDIYAFRNARFFPVKEDPSVLLTIQDNLIINGMVKDKTGGQPLVAPVYVLNTKTNKVLVLSTDINGQYSFPVEKGGLYMVKAMKPEYIEDCLSLRIPEDINGSINVSPRDLMLDKLEVDKVFNVENIYYDLNKWFIRDDAKPALDNLVDIMKKYPITAELSSHTDCRASDSYNNELSQKRAEAAVRYIILQGVESVRISAKGYGESRLVNRCVDGVDCSEAEHQANRRTEFRILSIEQATKQKDGGIPGFKTGDELDINLFDPGFFLNCNENN